MTPLEIIETGFFIGIGLELWQAFSRVAAEMFRKWTGGPDED